LIAHGLVVQVIDLDTDTLTGLIPPKRCSSG